MKLSASFLSIKDNIKENIKRLDNTRVDYLHLDIMDGIFVSNSTKPFSEIKELVSGTTKPYDVHLMVSDIKSYIDDYKALNPEYITFHIEVYDNPIDIINYIKSLGIKVGVSIKPNTDIDRLLPFLDKIDLVLVMSVEPGYGGQEFIRNAEDRIDELFEIRKNNNYDFLIEVDGGINDKTIEYCRKADIVVVGSFITNKPDYQYQIDLLKIK